jgi:hypothetical protein
VPHYLESQHPHGQPKQVHLRTHARIQLQNPASSFHPQLAMCPPVPARGAPWLPCTAGHAVVGPVWPDRAGGGRLAPPMPQGGPPSPRHRWPPPYGATNPVMFITRRLRPAFGEEPRGARGPPQAVPKAGPQVESWGVRSRLSALVEMMMSLHDTTGQIRYPDGSRFGLAYSPGLPRWHDRLFLRALRVSPYSTGFRRPTPPAIVRDPHPSGGSRPAVPPLACPYPNARVYDLPPPLR